MSGVHAHDLSVAARFGLGVGECVAAPAAVDVAAPGAGEIVLVTGASGSGKSTALRAMAARGRRTRAVVDVGAVRLRGASCVAHFGGMSAGSAMRALGAAGLADARVFLRDPSRLSDGQRWRLRLAVALERGGAGALVVADEWCSGLDLETARAVCRMVRRAVTARGIGFAAGCAREDLGAALGADVRVRLGLSGGARVERGPGRASVAALRFETGTRAAYEAMAGLHYLAGDPATVELVLTARVGGGLAGVLVASRPTLNGGHRRLAWGERYASGDKRADARRLNREVRCLSRVIVDPRFRGQGVARRLVARYLREPLTVCTEAVAAMGAMCPFFERAGMTAYRMTPSARAARLLDALEHAGLSREALCDGAAVRRALRAAGRRRFVERELRVWARSSRATGRKSGAGLGELVVLARERLAAEPVAYAHTSG